MPDWYALRHYWRSRALEESIPFDAINALMGHQVLGCDLYNRALNQTLATALTHGRALADIIAQEVGISVWCELSVAMRVLHRCKLA